MANLFKQKSRLRWFRNTFRQWMYPADFRIAEGVWSKNMVEQLTDALSALRLTANSSESPRLDDKHLVVIATRLWRLRAEMIRNAGSTQPDALRHAFRHLEVLWERFAEAGLDIDDLKDEIVSEIGDHPGLKVLAYQPTNRVTCHRVIDTVKPMIKFNKKIIQVGEVIVGYPEKSD